MASVNGQPLHRPGESIAPEQLRQRACGELLRQAAQDCGLLGVEDRADLDGVLSAEASEAIERLLDRELRVPEPDEAACRRHHAAQIGAYTVGERVHVRHILFAVTPGVDVRALRQKAEQVLVALRCERPRTMALPPSPPEGDESTWGGPALTHEVAPEAFAARAGELSNCPSGAQGGDLGWLQSADCAPEFAREIFGHEEVGVLARLVHSRFGLHVVEVLAREPGTVQPFESVAGAVRLAMQQHGWATALRQYLQVLAGAARLEGVDLEGSDSPLVQ